MDAQFSQRLPVSLFVWSLSFLGTFEQLLFIDEHIPDFHATLVFVGHRRDSFRRLTICGSELRDVRQALAEGVWVGCCTLKILQDLNRAVLGFDFREGHIAGGKLDCLLEGPGLVDVIVAEVRLLQLGVQTTTWSEHPVRPVFQPVDAVLWLRVVLGLPAWRVRRSVEVRIQELKLR